MELEIKPFKKGELSVSKKLYNNKHNTKSNPDKKVYKLRNWSEYNKALVNRGNITFWFSENSIKYWFFRGKHKKGAPQIYSDLAIETMLIIRSLFGLPLRNTQGFVESIIPLLGLGLTTPDYSTICRRQKHLAEQMNKIIRSYAKKEQLNIFIDSTGLKVFGEGEWKTRKYGYTKRRMWRKLHLGTDSDGMIIAQILTTNSVTDSKAGKEIIDNLPDNIESVTGDAGYDRKDIYDACKRKKCKPIIRPQTNARIRKEEVFSQRNKTIKGIKKLGSKNWRISSRYSARALIENSMFRYKTSFGDKPQARSLENQKTETALKCCILNKFYELGKPNSYLIA